MKVFISYAKEDYDIAKRLYDDLKKVEGLSPWIDKKLRPGENWKSKIYNEIKECSYFIVLLSSNSVSKKGYVQKELKIALEILEKFPSSEIFILPIRLDDCEPLDKLQDIHWVNLFPSYDDGLKEILHFFLAENHEQPRNEHEQKNEKHAQKRNKVIVISAILVLLVLFVVLTGIVISNTIETDINNNMKTATTALPKSSKKIEQLIKNADALFQLQQYTRPKRSNAYEFYQKVLELDPANQHALKKIHDILENLLNTLEKHIQEYGRLLNNETAGNDVKIDMTLILANIINVLEDSKKICEEFPEKSSETEQMIQIFNENIEKYTKLRELESQGRRQGSQIERLRRQKTDAEELEKLIYLIKKQNAQIKNLQNQINKMEKNAEKELKKMPPSSKQSEPSEDFKKHKQTLYSNIERHERQFKRLLDQEKRGIKISNDVVVKVLENMIADLKKLEACYANEPKKKQQVLLYRKIREQELFRRTKN